MENTDGYIVGRALEPLRGEGRELQDKHGKPTYFHADQVEVSPDGRTVYYQPNAGPLSSIEAVYLNDSKLTDAERARHVGPFADTGTAGRTAMKAHGNLYSSDTDRNQVLEITPTGKQSVLVHDPRLIWVDTMWITPDGKLWMPAAQMNRTPTFNNGENTVNYPMQVFTVDIGAGPAPNDHK